MIHDISDVEQQFRGLDLRGQIVRNRKAVLDELIASLRNDFQAGRFQAVKCYFASHHLRLKNFSGSGHSVRPRHDEGALDGTIDPTPETKQLCEGLSETLHAVRPPPEDAKGMAIHLTKAADLWLDAVGKMDLGMNKWWDEMAASGTTPSRFAIEIKKKKRNTQSS
jgi:hypothetical protein